MLCSNRSPVPQTYRTGDMAWWEKIADFWWGEGWEEWLVFFFFGAVHK